MTTITGYFEYTASSSDLNSLANYSCKKVFNVPEDTIVKVTVSFSAKYRQEYTIEERGDCSESWPQTSTPQHLNTAENLLQSFLSSQFTYSVPA